MIDELMKLVEKSSCLEGERRELGSKIDEVISKDLGGNWSVCVHLHYYPSAIVSVWIDGISDEAAEFKIANNSCTIKKAGAHSDRINKIKVALENALGVNTPPPPGIKEGRMKMVDCPHCDGMGGFIDFRVCRNSRSIDPPMTVCNMCNGRTVVSQDEYRGYKEAEDGDRDD